MKKTKIIAVAAGFLAAAGLTTAGNIFIGSEDVGDFTGNVTITGNGDVRFQSANLNGETSETTQQCDGANEISNGAGGCTCPGGYEYDFNGDCVPESEDTSGPSTPANCDGVPQAGTRGGTWTQFNRFPWETGERDKFTIENGDFMAVKFTAPAADKAGYIVTVAASHAPSALHSISISRCPGDFSSQELGDGVCKKESSNHSFWWSTFGKYQSSTCELVPGETYYMNFKYAKLNSLSTSTCSFNSCGQLLSWSNYE